VADNASKLVRYAKVARVFTPGAPINSQALFAGRMPQIMEVVNASMQRGQHAMLYGERGVGKTSLANVLHEFLSDATLTSVKVNCSTNDTFVTLWTRVFRELAIDPELDGTPVDPDDVRYLLQQRLVGPALVVIDELDRLDDDEALSLLADTVKALSDHSVDVTLVLVGVADSIDELVGDHHSIERAIVQVPMQRMPLDELVEIVDKGLDELDMTSTQAVKERIGRLSEGLPHYTHLLALHAAQYAVMDDRDAIDPADVDVAIKRAVQKATQSIQSSYQLATRSPRPDSQFEQVLLACALAPKNELGYFTAGSVRRPLSRIMGERKEIPSFARHLNKFTEPGRGAVLQKSGESRRFFYRFANPVLQPFVILNGIARGLVEEDLVLELQEESRSVISHGEDDGWQQLFDD
jgi:energy-coupling factor transporter ATP-binding protein EcfA2